MCRATKQAEIMTINGISYNIKKFLCMGGSSRIFEAQQIVSGQGVASDVLIKAYYPQEEAGKRLEYESIIGNKVRKCSNQVFPLEQAENGLAVLKKVSNSCKPISQILEEWESNPPMRKGAFKDVARIQYALNIVSSILNGLQRMHGNGILFLDASPGNVFYEAPEKDTDNSGKDGTAYFVDFGLSKIMDEKHEYKLGKNEVIDLTCSYAAPEMFRGDILTPATDLYAITALLLVLCVGRKAVFKDRWILSTKENQDRLYRSDFAVVRYALSWMELPKAIHNKLLDLLISGLSPNPQNRFNQSAEEMYIVVRTLADQCNAERCSFENYCINAAEYKPQITHNPYNPMNPMIKCYGREREYNALEAFLNDAAVFSWYTVTAPGGTGKTKLITSFLMTENLKEWKNSFNSWYILYIEDIEQIKKMLEFDDYNCSRNVLFFADDIGNKTRELTLLMQKILHAAKKPNSVRFLFTEREGFADDEYGETMQPSWFKAIVDPDSGERKVELEERYYQPNTTLSMAPLNDPKHVFRMLRDYCAFQKGDQDYLSDEVLDEIYRFIQDKKDEISGFVPSTLFYLLVLDEYLQGNNLLDSDYHGVDLLKTVIGRTEKSWKRICCNIEKGEEVYRHIHRIMVYATIEGRWKIGTQPEIGPFIPDANALNKLPADIMRQIASAVNETNLYDGYIYSMKPDLAGELYVADFITSIANDEDEKAQLAELLFDISYHEPLSNVSKEKIKNRYSDPDLILKIIKDFGHVQRYNYEISQLISSYALIVYQNHTKDSSDWYYNYNYIYNIFRLSEGLLARSKLINFEPKSSMQKKMIESLSASLSTLIDVVHLKYGLKTFASSVIDFWSYYLGYDLKEIENGKEVFQFINEKEYNEITAELLRYHTIKQLFVFPYTMFKDQEQLVDLNQPDYIAAYKEITSALRRLSFDEPIQDYKPREVPIRILTAWHQIFIDGLKKLYNSDKCKKTIEIYYSLWNSIYSGLDKEAYSLLDHILKHTGVDLLSDRYKAIKALEKAMQTVHEAMQYGIRKKL